MKGQSAHSDKELFLLISEGDESAFEELFHAYVPQLSPIVYQVVQSHSQVKDIIQEVFMHLWLGREKLRSIDEPRHWIFKITYNRSYLYIKRQIIQTKALANIRNLQETSSADTLAEQQVSLAETTRLVQEAIQQLGPQSLRIYELHRNEGMKPGDIATEVGISTQSVRNSLTRSVKAIREFLTSRGIIIPGLLLFLF